MIHLTLLSAWVQVVPESAAVLALQAGVRLLMHLWLADITTSYKCLDKTFPLDVDLMP